jgi:FkbM family methyltransferase
MGEDVPWLSEQIRPGMTVVDVGANIGFYTLLFADLAGPGGKVIAFEPHPDLYRAAAENVRRNGKSSIVRIHNCALGAQPGELYLQPGHVNSGDNRLRRSGGDRGRSIAVEVKRLDDVLASEKVDWIKIDVQGWECDVLEGMGETLARNRESLQVCMEFWPRGIRQAGRDPMEAIAILRRAGYALYRRESAAAVADGELEEYSRKAGRLTFLNLLARRMDE